MISVVTKEALIPHLFATLLYAASMWGAVCLAPLEMNAGEVDFNRDVRPILSEACFQCHGPDAEHREADLRLDIASQALAKLDDHFAIVPGNLSESTVVERITSTDADLRMPPPDSERKLSPSQIEIIKQWIQQGAKYEKHWAFQPIRDPQIPVVKQKDWVRNEIDAFVLHRLEEKGIAPSPQADRYTLIRRVTIDLTGLPPTPKEVEEYLHDHSENAYEKMVDRVLSSPHYGEKWGRHWLDQARYADTDGYTVDSKRSIWLYRDCVINALNRDMPFDQFTIEQLAGDLLEKPTTEQLIATGFHRNTLINGEGGTDNEQFRNEEVVDRVNTTGAVWLGLTIGCAQCHNHKFDPISQREYYELFAFFNSSQDVNTRNPKLMVPSPQQRETLGQIEQRLKQAQEKLAAYDAAKKSLPPEKQNAGKAANWHVVPNLTVQSTAGATFEKLDDSSYLAGGNNGNSDEYRVQFSSPLRKITAIRLETLTHPSLPQTGPGRASNGNFVLNEVELSQGEEHPAKWLHAMADHSQKDYPVSAAIDGKMETGWAINVAKGNLNVNRTARFILESPITASPETSLSFKMKFGAQPARYNIGRFRISVTDATVSQLGVPDKEREKLLAAVKKVRDAKAKFVKKIPTTLIMRELAQPRETHVLIRGDFLRHGELVHPATPAVLTVDRKKQEQKKLTRLDLARWLVDKNNPLTARVTVNRIWMRYFGRGLVQTENDFGYQGTLPTHPLLLDWLASSFMKNGWSQKKLHKLIVTSATYRQASLMREDLAQIDPNNKWLARQSRLRVDAELVRDLALSVSGLLSEKIGGPSVFPPQPPGVYSFTQNKYQWKTSTGEDRYRRGMYTFFIRSAPYPMLTTFDVPRFNATCTRRNRSNTPLQSLAMANDEAMIEMARALGNRILKKNFTDDNHRLKYAFQLCLTRPPSSQELAQLRRYLNQQREIFQADPKNAQLVAGNTAKDQSGKSDHLHSVSEAASWACVARVLMNLDEFITRE